MRLEKNGKLKNCFKYRKFLIFFFFQQQSKPFHVCNNVDNCLKYLNDKNEFDWAICASRQNILNSPFYLPSKYVCFDQSAHIKSYFVSLMMRNDFKMKIKINKIIRNLFEAGIFVKWQRDNQIRSKYEIPFLSEFNITLDDYGIFFLIYFGGFFTASILVFCLENVILWKMRQRKINRIWFYLDRIVDAERYYFIDLIDKISQRNTNEVFEFRI